jgi:itaconyl-CoA hydratase
MQVRPGWRGRYFEDFEVGDVYQHRRGRTITETDNTWFTLLTLNTNQVHYNADYAGRSEFGRVLVNSGFTIGLLLGMTVQDVSENAIANLGMDDVRLTHPVFVGDTLYGETLVLAARESASRPHAGIVTVSTRGLNQDGDVCIVYRRSVMVHKRDSPHLEDDFPEAKDDWTLGG